MQPPIICEATGEEVDRLLVAPTGVSAGASSDHRSAAIRSLMSEAAAAGDAPKVKAIVDRMLSDRPGAAFPARSVMKHLTEVIVRMPEEARLDVANFALGKLSSRVGSFEDEECFFRELVARQLIDCGNYTAAAKCLAQLQLEGGGKSWTAAEKAEKYLRIAELFFEDDDAVSAEQFCNRASKFVRDESVGPVLSLRYEVTHSRVLDCKLRFVEAAGRYYELSQNPRGLPIEEADLLRLLTDSVLCAVLAPPGAQRFRLLGALLKDPRLGQTPALAGIAHKVFAGRIVSAEEEEEFTAQLKVHQKAALADGQTVATRAILHHNVTAASKLYTSLKLDDLGRLLHTDAGRAERAAVRMVLEKRLRARVDQKQGAILFRPACGQDAKALQDWDLRTELRLQGLRRLAEDINALSAAG